MKKILAVGALTILGLLFCSRQPDNPFFAKWKTPFATPPYEQIKTEHFLPAFQEGLKQDSLEIAAIINNSAPPTFENSVVALTETGEMLSRISAVFYNLLSARTSDTLEALAQQIAPLLSKHSDDILMNVQLFERIKTVYEQKDKLQLTAEQATLLEEWYRDFTRGGANLDEAGKARLRAINEELALLTLKFGQNVLKETNNYELVIGDSADLSGLPADVIATAAETAKERGKTGQWIFTTQKPSMIPFLQYADRRDLREKIFKAYINRGANNNEYDNKAVSAKIAALRVERANLLGYRTHADFVLEENMAKNPARVYQLLDQLWAPALQRAQMEVKELQAIAKKEGQNLKIQPWDWWYYAEKLRREKYALDDELLRPYFNLENVRQGAFDVANKLWGITFTERADIPKYHPDVKVFEVREANGKHIGVLYVDYFPRDDKKSGAWSSSLREQYRLKGQMITPINVNVFNFTRPTPEKPSLLTLEEAKTLYHELGHALHDLLSNCTYAKLTGTNVPRDFVELPSQIMENWATHPEVLKSYAKHYQTGEPIPDELITKIQQSNLFNQGFETVEFLAAAYLDMDWHTLNTAQIQNVTEFENAALKRIKLMPEIVVRYRSPYFQHIFAGGYSAGYYSYIWAEVLDADAFQAFEEKGIFDPETAKAFRENILARGGSEDPMVLYKRFRGAEPKIDALLTRRGLK